LIRTVWVIVAGAVLTVVLAGRVVVTSWFRGSEVAGLCERLGRAWSGAILRWSGARVRLIGADAVEWNQPLVVVANHQSWFDVFALSAHLPARARFVAKEELSRIPIFGPAWMACGHISVDRSDRAKAIESLDAAGRRVRDEALAMILFPEGTRSVDGRLQSFKKGAFVLAIKTGVPVLPVGIAGSRAVMPKGSFRIRKGEIRVRVGRPISTAGLTSRDRDALMGRSRRQILELMEDPDGLGPTAESDHDPDEGRRG
jgi:1-acyl-sn-glycerol-3-phosphate acyltransferase